jgi:cytidylate kinase
MTSILNVISAMAEVATTSPQGGARRPQRPVVTISRDYGSGGDIIAERLAQRLDLPIFDEVVLKEVAARLQDDPAIVRLLDEGFGRAKDMWLYRLFSGKDVSPDSYRDTLVKVVMSLGRLGGVLVGRGAHVILAESCALRVRIAGSPEACARRLAAAGQGSYEDLMDKVNDVNHRRGKFVWEVFHSRLSDAHQFDLTINTDRMDDFEDVVDVLVPLAQAIHAGKVLRSDYIHV